MRISVKGRYALAAMIYLAQHYSNGEYITVISISGHLGISKIYLEQVFSLLRRSGLVHSVKGSQGGYQLQRMPWQTTAWDVLSAVELPLFEPAEDTVSENAPEMDRIMHASVFEKMDAALRSLLSGITLLDLVTDLQNYNQDQGPMFYI